MIKIIERLSRIMVFVLSVLILFYKKAISPHFLPVCRFYPSCSTYALESIKKYGTVKGVFLATKRILRCHPLNKGGYDPVP